MAGGRDVSCDRQHAAAHSSSTTASALTIGWSGFATNGVNMTKLESYQQGTSFAATTFYAAIIGAPGDEAVDRALEECAFHSKELRILGSYEQGRTRG